LNPQGPVGSGWPRQPGLGPGRLEQLHRVAGRVLQQDLLAAHAGDDLVAEPDTRRAQPLGAGGIGADQGALGDAGPAKRRHQPLEEPFGAAMLGALWAYDGWSNVAPLSGEIRNPQRNLPRAFVGGMLVVASLYLFVNLGYFYAMSPLEIASVPTSSSVATEVLKRFLGPMAVSMTAVALMVSSFGSLHSSVLANSRVPYAMARDGLFFRALGHLSPRSNVPVRAILAQAAWGSVLALSGSYDSLTDSVVFASWLFYGLSTGSLFIFRRTMPAAERPYRALGYPVVPVIFLLVTGALLINTFIAAPNEAVKGVAVLVAGLPLYWYWSRKNPVS